MNLNELVGNKEMSLMDKLNLLEELKTGLNPKITNDKPLTFNTNYIFRKDFDNQSYNDQGKEVDLAIKILNLTRHGNRKYNIMGSKKVSTECFKEFFKQYIEATSNNLIRGGCYINANNGIAMIKSLVIWANKLFDRKIISTEILNKFLEYMEDVSE